MLISAYQASSQTATTLLESLHACLIRGTLREIFKKGTVRDEQIHF